MVKNLQLGLALKVECQQWPLRSLSCPGKKKTPLPRDSESRCALCRSLLYAALAASKQYHSLLADLEASHIYRDPELPFLIQGEVPGALLNRDAAIAALAEHERIHAKTSTEKKDSTCAPQKPRLERSGRFRKDLRREILKHHVGSIELAAGVKALCAEDQPRAARPGRTIPGGHQAPQCLGG